MKIRGVLFDLDETLIEEEVSNDAAAFVACDLGARRAGVERDELFRAMRQRSQELWLGGPMIDYCRQIGISSREGLWGTFSSDDAGAETLRAWIPEYRMQSWRCALQDLGVHNETLATELAETFAVERRARHVVFPETVRVLDDLRADFRLALITNGATDIQREKIDGSRLGVFETVLISGTFGFGKPNRGIFEAALSRLGVSAGEAVMIGDSLSRDVEGAAALGIRTVWINRLGKARPERFRAPDFEISDLVALPSIIRALE